jgi:tetratricopeptide (TPR) repeat protein
MSLSLQRLLILLVLFVPPALTQAQESSEPAADNSSADSAVQQASEQAQADTMLEEAGEQAQQLLRDSAFRLETELAQRGEQVGAFDVTLAEVQLDLGRIYLELGEHDLAIAALQQALQLVRINQGLYDAGQIPVIELLVANYRAQSEWDHVDDYQHLVFSLQQRTYQKDSAEFADAVLAMGDWQVLASRGRLAGRSGTFQALDRLSDLKDLYADVRVHAEERGDVSRQWEIMYSTALVDIEIARQYLTTNMDDMMISASRYVVQTVCRAVSDGAGGFQRVCWQQSVSNPDYHRQADSQRRTQLERAKMNLQSARSDMQTLIDNNPAFVSDNTERTEAGMQNLNNVLEDLQRESRRTTLGGFW